MKPVAIAGSRVSKNDKKPLCYRECGLDNIYLIDGYEIESTPYGEGLSVKNLDELHEAIGLYLAQQKKVLTGQELRYLRTHMEMTQAQLGKLMGLGSQQVARYEKGQSEISGPVELLVRNLFVEVVGGKVKIRKLSESLASMDAPPREKSVFENTAEGWKARTSA